MFVEEEIDLFHSMKKGSIKKNSMKKNHKKTMNEPRRKKLKETCAMLKLTLSFDAVETIKYSVTVGSSATSRFYAFLSCVSCFYTLVSHYTTLCNLSTDIGHVI